MDDDGDVVFIEEDDNIDERKFEEQPAPTTSIIPKGDILRYNEQISIFKSVFPGFYINDNIDYSFSFSIPTKVLPQSMISVYGFYKNPVLLNCKITLDQLNWRRPPKLVSFSNPVYGENFIGSALINQIMTSFFSGYSPSTYHSFANLTSLGCNRNQMDHCLHQGFLFCPPFFLVLEIIESFLRIPSNCCICGSPLPFKGIKPTVCNKELCKFAFQKLGIGTSVIQEIRRDPVAADLIFSVFSCGDMSFLEESPPPSVLQSKNVVFNNLPSMQDLASRYSNDAQLHSAIGEQALDVLRWVILSQRSHIVSLPGNLRINQIKCSQQFMTIISSPEAEAEFTELKNRYGSRFLFHGSHGDRWCPILRNGLKNASGSKMMLNGAAHGNGIYLAPSSSTSWGYCTPLDNKYKNSKLGNHFSLIAVCEVAKVPELKDHGWAFTLTKESACIVRFLMVGQFDFTFQDKKYPIPTIQDIINYQTKH